MIHIWNSCFENICSSIKRFYICTEVPVEFQKFTGRIYRRFRFSSRKSQSQQKLAKKVAHLTIQFRSKNVTHFTNLNSLNMENTMLP